MEGHQRVWKGKGRQWREDRDHGSNVFILQLKKKNLWRTVNELCYFFPEIFSFPNETKVKVNFNTKNVS